ncbi:MAG: YicC family protein [Clostridia bacterium]|nr:YicC family protein [Clostridia bacterium]
MIRSMTGYGRGNLTFDGRDYTVEIRTVNHRYNDVFLKMPRYLIALEDPLRQLVAKNISRGKTDVFVTVNNTGTSSKNIKIDEELAATYISEMKRISDMYNIENDITTTSLIKLPDMIISDNKVDEDLYWNEVKACTELALENLKNARETEGRNLKDDILKRLEKISSGVDEMEEKSAGLVEEYRKKLKNRLAELDAIQIVDENRIAAELVLFADKSSICEEITRLRSHIKSLTEMLNNDGAIGKKLDFLVQEMNREVNTIGSKANCIDITNCVVDTKNEIENIREQIQNIE